MSITKNKKKNNTVLISLNDNQKSSFFFSPISIHPCFREQKSLILNYATGESFNAIKQTFQSSVDAREKESLSARRLLDGDGHGAITFTFPSLAKSKSIVNYREENRFVTSFEDASKYLKPFSFLTHRLFDNVDGKR